MSATIRRSSLPESVGEPRRVRASASVRDTRLLCAAAWGWSVLFVVICIDLFLCTGFAWTASQPLKGESGWKWHVVKAAGPA
jgi:hypothetical protein